MPNEDFRLRRAEAERRQKRRSTIITCVFVIVVIVVMLSVGAFALEHDGNHGTTGSAARDAGDLTREVVDSSGRTVRLPETVDAIACMDSFCGEMVVMAGGGAQLCGVPNGVKSDVLLQRMYDGLAEVHSTSGSAVNIEQFMSDGCDVVLVRDTLTSAERQKLSNAQIPYVIVSYEDVPGQIEAMRLVGEVCGGDAMQRADELANFAERTVKLVEERAARLSAQERKSVYHSINSVLTCDGAGSLGADWIDRTGCLNVSRNESAGSQGDYQATLEQIYAWNPMMVICNNASATEEFGSQQRWAGLEAVAMGQLLTIPTAATRWGQRGSVETYLGMLWLGCTAYPELYGDIDLRSYVSDYYRQFFGIEIDDELWETILSGEGLRASATGNGAGGGNGNGGN